jgi:hypothetical protein
MKSLGDVLMDFFFAGANGRRVKEGEREGGRKKREGRKEEDRIEGRRREGGRKRNKIRV